jgi:hypothetical protein
MKYSKMFLLMLFVSLFATAAQDHNATEKRTAAFYLKNFSGQKDINLYSDTFYPSIQTNYVTNQLSWQEVEFENTYIQSLISLELFRLNTHLSQDIIQASLCSPTELGQFQDYIQYLYRLISMSYLFEVMLDNQQKSKVFTTEYACDTSKFNQLIEQCQPKQSDMSSFIRNIKQMNLMMNHQAIKTNKSKSILEMNQLLKDQNNEDITVERLKLFCLQNKFDCSSLTERELVIFLNKTCEEDQKLFKKICSEEDKLMGLSSIPQALDLILKSNASQVLSRQLDAASCLHRWSEISSIHEEIPHQLPLIFPLVSMSLEKGEHQYIQGRLFVAGALREFEEKGLAQIFATNTPAREVIKTEKKVVPANTTKPSIRVDKKITVIDQSPPPQAKPEIIAIQKIEPTLPKKSAFLIAYEEMYQLNRSNNFVDMIKFRYDYIFSFKMLRDLKEPLRLYTSIEALREMKAHDRLGTIDGPVPLSFVKYLIDTHQHHGLYNIISVLSDKFYVLNDIDENISKKIYYLSLKNDETTQLRWQIMTLKE